MTLNNKVPQAKFYVQPKAVVWLPAYHSPRLLGKLVAPGVLASAIESSEANLVRLSNAPPPPPTLI